MTFAPKVCYCLPAADTRNPRSFAAEPLYCTSLALASESDRDPFTFKPSRVTAEETGNRNATQWIA